MTVQEHDFTLKIRLHLAPIPSSDPFLLPQAPAICLPRLRNCGLINTPFFSISALPLVVCHSKKELANLGLCCQLPRIKSKVILRPIERQHFNLYTITTGPELGYSKLGCGLTASASFGPKFNTQKLRPHFRPIA